VNISLRVYVRKLSSDLVTSFFFGNLLSIQSNCYIGEFDLEESFFCSLGLRLGLNSDSDWTADCSTVVTFYSDSSKSIGIYSLACVQVDLKFGLLEA
jgi:hypothetical protein